MTLSLYNLGRAGALIGAGFILLIISYNVLSAFAYGIARSVLQAIRDHRTETKHRIINKEKQNENNRRT
jgi:hypothetical protein